MNDAAATSRCLRCSQAMSAASASGLCDTCQAQVTELFERPSAAAVGPPARYELLELLGRGGMGEVYRARDRTLDRIVALKWIAAHRAADESFLARFRREALAMARLNHPQIVAIYDHGELDGRPYLAMEFVPGTTLRERLRRGRLAPSEAFALIRQLSSAVAYAHDLGVVHRDLKPENILVALDGQLKLADFGLAKVASSRGDENLTAEGAVLGTLRYMAPEQLAGDPRVDARADVYSLGAIAYELLTGQTPLGRFLPPSRLAAIRSAVDSVILRALATEPDHRFATAGEFAEAFAAAIGDSAVSGASNGGDGAGSPSAHSRLASGSVMPGLVGNVDSDQPPLIGRADDRRWLQARLSVARLITLTGPGGTGKTRLAIQVALDSADRFPDGIWFVPLAEHTDARRVPDAVAAALGVKEEPPGVFETLRRHLTDRSTLLILDNFEHLASAASFVSKLLDAAPRLRILATSRAPLRLKGEFEFRVTPLTLPDAGSKTLAPSDVAESSAVTLFVERARRVRPDFQVTAQNAACVADICRRLDGLPLAVELAAARLKVLSVEALAERLASRLKLLTGGARDLPERQRTMRGAIEWSYDLLEPPQRTLLVWLAVLRGSFDLGMVEEFARRLASLSPGSVAPLPRGGEPLDEFDVLDAFEALVDHSLLRRDALEPTPRWSMFETVREFCDDAMEESEQRNSLAEAHAEWCYETLRRDEPIITGSHPEERLSEWDVKLADFRAAIAWCAGPGTRPLLAVRMLGELWYYWVLRGGRAEGIDLLSAAIERAGEEAAEGPDAPPLSRAFHALGTLLYLSDRPREARQAFERALEIRRRCESDVKIYATLGNLAALKRAEGDLVGSIRDTEACVAFHRRNRNQRSLAVALSNLALTYQLAGQYAAAHRAIEESLRIYESLSDDRGVSRQYLNLGRLLHLQERFPEALDAFRKSEALCPPQGDRSGRLNAKLAIANVLVSLERYSEALELFDECAAEMANDDSPSRLASYEIARGYYEWRIGNCDAALEHYRVCLRLRREHGDRLGMAEVLLCVAEVYVTQSRFADAVRLLGAEEALRSPSGGPLDPGNQRTVVKILAAAANELKAERVAELTREGAAWPLERVGELAYR